MPGPPGTHTSTGERRFCVLVPVRAGPVHTHLRAPRVLSANSDGSFSYALQRCCGARTVSPAGYVTYGCPVLFSPPPCRSAIKFATRYLTRVRVAVSPASLFLSGWSVVLCFCPSAPRFKVPLQAHACPPPLGVPPPPHAARFTPNPRTVLQQRISKSIARCAPPLGGNQRRTLAFL